MPTLILLLKAERGINLRRAYLHFQLRFLAMGPLNGCEIQVVMASTTLKIAVASQGWDTFEASQDDTPGLG